MIQKIESGPVEVIASGTVIAFSGNPITIAFEEQGKKSVKVIFEFKDEEGKKDYRVEGIAVDSLTLKLTLFNFKSQLGIGTNEPLTIGELGGRRFYFQYRIHTLTDKADKMLHYTFYIGEKVNKNG